MSPPIARVRFLLACALGGTSAPWLAEGCARHEQVDLDAVLDGSPDADAPDASIACTDAPFESSTSDGSCPPGRHDASEDDAGDSAASDAKRDAAGADATDEPAFDGGEDGDLPGDASVDGDVLGGGSITFLDASCRVEIDEPPLLPAIHVAIGSAIQWDSNPPSSGPHYPIWAAYQAYTEPVPRGYYVHDLEHGAIVFLYNCGDAGCPDVVDTLQAASDSIPDDPLCTAAGEGVRVRTVITPDPLIDVPVAAAAWGWVYKAQCADPATLRQFALEHYGQGPEVLCSNGTPVF